jgi:CheY-like chemotaxis protein
MRPKRTIIVVDPAEGRLSVRRFMFETRGFRVLGASCRQEAIDLWEQPVDVAFIQLDLGLHEVSGSELITELRSLRPGVPMVLTSPHVRPGEIAHPADAFLGKGYDSPADIVERLKILAQRKRGPKSVTALGVAYMPEPRRLA